MLTWYVDFFFMFHLSLKKNVSFSLLLSSGMYVTRSNLLTVLFKSSISSQFFVCLVHWNLRDVTEISHYEDLSASYIPISFCLFKFKTMLLNTSSWLLDLPGGLFFWSSCRLRPLRGPVKGILLCPSYEQIQKREIKSNLGIKITPLALIKVKRKHMSLLWRCSGSSDYTPELPTPTGSAGQGQASSRGVCSGGTYSTGSRGNALRAASSKREREKNTAIHIKFLLPNLALYQGGEESQGCHTEVFPSQIKKIRSWEGFPSYKGVFLLSLLTLSP